MTIKEFIEAYKGKKFINTQQGMDERVEWLKSTLGVKEYIPFDKKQAIVQTVLRDCSNISNDVVFINSTQKYLLFTMAMLVAYTNIELDENVSFIDVYDELCSCQIGESTLLDMIIKTFEIEYSRCNNILNMMTADLLAENNIEVQVGKFLSNLSDKINKFGDKLIDKLENFDKGFDQVDINNFINIINKLK